MRDIHIAHLDEARPVLVLTRDSVREVLNKVTVAPIKSTIKGLSTEVLLGPRNGLSHESAVTCDNIMTIDSQLLGRHVGLLFDEQEPQFARAVMRAFELSLG
ncbi:MAG TPA: type II toxin-antitoxin system PemK/MazF family toxin [Nocardioidaceae bacterium]|nr:type II toxin-antitoxin system PemK/MazF family toxin [Nocardioidaceae bacterium]